MSSLGRALGGGVVAAAGLLLVLQAGLAPEAFFAGDSGVKLVATRHALARPTKPLEIPLPTIGDRGVPFVDPFYRVHGDHRHAVTPELFPILTAPFLATWGARGVYILPALGWLAALAAWTWIAVRLDPRRRPALVFSVGILATPWLFYALEFWEHAAALGVAGLATAFLIRRGADRESGVADRVAAGALLGVATLLRPEAACYAAALVVAWALTSRDRRSQVLLVAAAATAVVMPLLLYNLVHFGAVVSPHLSGLSGSTSETWLARRGALFMVWFMTPSTMNAWYVAPVCALAFVPLRGDGPSSGRQFLLTTALVTAVLVWLVAPNDGGAEWGPRYLLFAFAPLVPLVADRLQALARRGGVGVALVACILVVGAWTQRSAYGELRGAKETYARVLAFVRDTTPSGGIVVTDLWWLDQVAASAGERRFLYVGTREDHAEVFNKLSRDEGQLVTLVRGAESPLFRSDMLFFHSCFAQSGRRTLADRQLVAQPFLVSCF